MAVIQFSRILGIGDQVTDLLRDFRTAQVPMNSRGAAIYVYATGGGDGVFCDFFVGERNVLERSELSQKATMPIKPEDLLLGPEPGRPLERLVMSADNQSGASRTVRVHVDIQEL